MDRTYQMHLPGYNYGVDDGSIFATFSLVFN